MHRSLVLEASVQLLLPWAHEGLLERGDMSVTKSFQLLAVVVLGLALLLPGHSYAQAETNQAMGELQFTGTTKVENDSGLWVDGQYVGFLKELKGDKKIMLSPGEHAISVRQAGYEDFAQTVVIEAGKVQTIHLRMTPNPQAFYHGSDAAELKLNVKPPRSEVFIDDSYVGHGSEFGGAFRALLVPPGKHRIKVTLPGYQTFETEMDLRPKQKSRFDIDLVTGKIFQARAATNGQ